LQHTRLRPHGHRHAAVLHVRGDSNADAARATTESLARARPSRRLPVRKGAAAIVGGRTRACPTRFDRNVGRPRHRQSRRNVCRSEPPRGLQKRAPWLRLRRWRRTREPPDETRRRTGTVRIGWIVANACGQAVHAGTNTEHEPLASTTTARAHSYSSPTDLQQTSLSLPGAPG